MIKYLFTAFLFYSAFSSADEVLDIIEGSQKTAPVEVTEVYSPLVVSLKKLLPKATAEQNILFNFLTKEKYDLALFQWPSAFENTTFAKTENGKALYYFLLYKNGLQVNALESLLKVNANKVDMKIKKTWVDLVKPDNQLWSLVEQDWNPSWTASFGTQTEAVVSVRRALGKNKSKILLDLLRKVPKESYARQVLVWELAIDYAVHDEREKSAKLISFLLKNEKSHVSKDLLNITIARLLYQKGFLDHAITYYKKVSKSSEYWFVAQEEIAWSYIRKGEPQNTLAVTKSLVQKDFERMVGPETIFLRSLASLKICDYKGVQREIVEFRDRFKTRTKKLMALIENQDTAQVKELIAQLKKKRVRLKDLGALAKDLPFYVSRDEKLYRLAQIQKQLEEEAGIAEKLYLQSMNEGTAQVGFMASMEYLKKSMLQSSERARAASAMRIKKLAEVEVNDIQHILQKMHIVEAELLQQISVSQDVANAKTGTSLKKGSTGSVGKDTIEFPFDGEIWFDEIDNYRIDVANACKRANVN